LDEHASACPVFVTGGTGLIGSYLIRVLLDKGHKVYALTRAENERIAEARIEDSLSFWGRGVLSECRERLCVVPGDVTAVNLGLNVQHSSDIKQEVVHVFHCAGVVKFNSSEAFLDEVNVLGTKNLLDFTLGCNKLQRVNHVSTAFVCGDHVGVFNEEDLDVGQRFQSEYARSKFRAEILVQEYRQRGLWVDVFRPPLVLAESGSGKTLSYDQAFYQMMRLMCSEYIDPWPIKNAFVNIVCVDELCNSIYLISSKFNSRNKNYHVFSPELVSLEAVLHKLHAFFEFTLPKVVDKQQFLRGVRSNVHLSMLRHNVLQFNEKVEFDSRKTCELLQEHGLGFSGFWEKCFSPVLEAWLIRDSRGIGRQRAGSIHERI